MNKAITNLFRSISSARKSRNESRRRASRKPRQLHMDALEKREMFSVSSLSMLGSTLVIQTDNASTSVVVSKVGNEIKIADKSSGHNWAYHASRVGMVEFHGGNGDDKFVDNVSNLAAHAFGGAGNDILVGGNGNDQLWGGAGNDTLFGGVGNDQMLGEAGDDYLNGEAGADQLWGGDGNDAHADGNDILLGGDGDDYLMGERGDDHLNGQAGADQMWGGAGNDVLISLDAAYADYLEGGANADVMWIDRAGSVRDRVYAAGAGDVVQEVSSFANGADRTLNGDNLIDPSSTNHEKRTYSYARFSGNSLFSSSGPDFEDINQGDEGDCWLLSGLSTIAKQDADVIRRNVVDFDDGTYGVHLGNKFYRVDNQLPYVDYGGSSFVGEGDIQPAFAGIGDKDNRVMWVAVVEKAFADYRTGANSYASLNNGLSSEVFKAFGCQDCGSRGLGRFSSASDMANQLNLKWKSGYAMTVYVSCTLGGYHEFAVDAFKTDSQGHVTGIELRNPWGWDALAYFPAFKNANGGANADNGRFTVSISQLFKSNGTVEWAYV